MGMMCAPVIQMTCRFMYDQIHWDCALEIFIAFAKARCSRGAGGTKLGARQDSGEKCFDPR